MHHDIIYGMVVNIIVHLRPIRSIKAIVRRHPNIPPIINIEAIQDFSLSVISTFNNAGEAHPYIIPVDAIHKLAVKKKETYYTFNLFGC